MFYVSSACKNHFKCLYMFTANKGILGFQLERKDVVRTAKHLIELFHDVT